MSSIHDWFIEVTIEKNHLFNQLPHFSCTQFISYTILKLIIFAQSIHLETKRDKSSTNIFQIKINLFEAWVKSISLLVNNKRRSKWQSFGFCAFLHSNVIIIVKLFRLTILIITLQGAFTFDFLVTCILSVYNVHWGHSFNILTWIQNFVRFISESSKIEKLLSWFSKKYSKKTI